MQPPQEVDVDMTQDQRFQALRGDLQSIDQGDGRLTTAKLEYLGWRVGPYPLSTSELSLLQQTDEIVLLHLKGQGVAFEQVFGVGQGLHTTMK